MTKTEHVAAFLQLGNYKAALKLVKDFKLGLEVKEKQVLRTAYECSCGEDRVRFYRSLGVEVDKIMEEAKKIMLEKWLKAI